MVCVMQTVFNGSAAENANEEALHETLDTSTLQQQQQQQPSTKSDFEADPMETTTTTPLPTNNNTNDSNTQEEYLSAGAFKVYTTFFGTTNSSVFRLSSIESSFSTEETRRNIDRSSSSSKKAHLTFSQRNPKSHSLSSLNCSST